MTTTTHQVTSSELPVCCPPINDANSWSEHPRVFLPLTKDNPAVACPYCGARFAYKASQ